MDCMRSNGESRVLPPVEAYNALQLVGEHLDLGVFLIATRLVLHLLLELLSADALQLQLRLKVFLLPRDVVVGAPLPQVEHATLRFSILRLFLPEVLDSGLGAIPTLFVGATTLLPNGLERLAGWLVKEFCGAFRAGLLYIR